MGTLLVLASTHGPVVQSSVSQTAESLASDVCEFNRIKKFGPDGKFIMAWGKYGVNDGEFLHPHSIDVDSSGNVYVNDHERRVIQKFDNDGRFITKWGSDGEEAGSFGRLEGEVALDAHDNVYVADWGNSRIQVFDKNGKFITMWGERGTDNGQFERPWGIGFGPDGNVYVTEHDLVRIQVFDKNGKFLKVWWKEGENEINQTSDYVRLHDIDFDKVGNSYVVVDTFVKKFDKNGSLVMEWGSKGREGGLAQFNDPHGIDFDSRGNLYIADTGNARIQKFTTNGTFIGAWGNRGLNDNDFIMPEDVAVDSDDNIFVSDNGVANLHTNVRYIKDLLELNPPPPSCDLGIGGDPD
jgi:tripartite motif-containing protein 71